MLLRSSETIEQNVFNQNVCMQQQLTPMNIGHCLFAFVVVQLAVSLSISLTSQCYNSIEFHKLKTALHKNDLACAMIDCYMRTAANNEHVKCVKQTGTKRLLIR